MVYGFVRLQLKSGLNTEASAILRGILRLFCLRNPRKIADPSVHTVLLRRLLRTALKGP